MAATLKTATWQAMTHSGAPNSQVTTGVSTIKTIAVRFTLRSMLPSRCQLSINGPKERCSRNQLFSRSEERAKAKAATSRNGVVGNNGTTRPTAAIATDISPASNQRALIPESTLPVHHTRAGTDKFGRYKVMGSEYISYSDPITSCRRARLYTIQYGAARRGEERLKQDYLQMRVLELAPQVYVSGQLFEHDVRLAAKHGVRSIMNNRPDGESAGQPLSADLAKVAEELGMTFLHLPINPRAITSEDVAAFAKARGELEQPLLIFCRSGARSTRLWELTEYV